MRAFALTGAKTPFHTPRVFDVIVIGLGAMGLAAACEIAATGAKVLGLEQFAPGHDRGASHGKTRMIRKAYLEGDFYIPLLERAFERWPELAKRADEEIFNPCGVLYSAPEGDPIIAHTRASALRYRIPLETFSADDAARRFPNFRRPENHACLFEPGGGYVNPDAALDLYRKLAAQHGAELRFKTEVAGIDLENKIIRVKTRNETFSAHRLVVTAGPWLAKVGALAGFTPPLTIRRMALHWFKPEGTREDFRPGPLVPNVFRASGGGFLYGFPWTRAETGLKYAFHDRQNPPTDPGTPNRVVGKEEISEIRDAVGEVLAAPVEHVASKTCLYAMTPDQHFLIGLLPGDERVAVAGGFSGHGFKFTPVVGEILRDLALDGASEHDLSRFAPGRFDGKTP